jgi:hypothetical protein
MLRILAGRVPGFAVDGLLSASSVEAGQFRRRSVRHTGLEVLDGLISTKVHTGSMYYPS